MSIPVAPTSRPLINRELSWLAFNGRVLQEAIDVRNPLLERLKFLAIFSTNLDEFYMVRVAGLRRQVAAGVTQPSMDGLTPLEQLDAIRKVVREQLARQREALAALFEALAANGIELLDVRDLSPMEWAEMDAYFESQVFPVLTPLAVDLSHPFPYISNLSISLAVEIRDPESGDERFARVKVPRSLPRWVPVAGRSGRFVPLEEVIGKNLGALFPGMDILRWYAFRITRYADLELPVEEPEDLLQTIEEQIFKRRFGEVVRLEVQDEMPAHLRALLLDELREDDVSQSAALAEGDVHDAGSLLGLGDLMALHAIDAPALKETPFTPSIPTELRDPDRSILDAIRERDILVHHPFESFGATVERFLETAAEDENVLAIKLTLYRTSGDTAIVDALIAAARSGKQVAVLVELKARFDEANNISWAKQLESVGVHVAYGSANLKTHAKVALVVRREADGIRRYVHLGSGNYNSRTARQYTDVGLFTCSPSIAADVTDLFNSLTGYSRQRRYRSLIVAPLGMRTRFIELIDRETTHAAAGRPARVIAKMNALVDPDVIEALCRASRAGVAVDLVCRGICCLRPGVEGVSDRVRVVSIVGRFLEHSRLYYFANGGTDECYLGSADWMPRNFDRRVEAVAPVRDPALLRRLRRLLHTCLVDNRQAWELGADAVWRHRSPEGETFATHEILMRDPWGLPSETPNEMPARTEDSLAVALGRS